MFKNPVKANGDIRYFELFKIMILFSFLISLFSKNTSSIINPVSSSYFLSALFNIVVLIHVSTLVIAQFSDILEMIKSFIQEWMYSKRVYIAIARNAVENVYTTVFVVIKTYLLNNVIRC